VPTSRLQMPPPELSHQRADCGHRARAIQSGVRRSLLHIQEASHCQGADVLGCLLSAAAAAPTTCSSSSRLEHGRVRHRSQLERLIGVPVRRCNKDCTPSNEMSVLVNQANGGGTVWAVLKPRLHPPGDATTRPGGVAIPRRCPTRRQTEGMTIRIKADSGVDARFEAVCGSGDDANTFAALLKQASCTGAISGQHEPGTQPVARQRSSRAFGDRLALRLSLTDDQMAGLIRRNTSHSRCKNGTVFRAAAGAQRFA